MTVEECYAKLGGDYKEALYRFKNETKIKKYLKMMLEDENYKLLDQALQVPDYESAFRAVHSLKGISLNLGLKDLAEVTAKLTDSLKAGTRGSEIAELFKEVKECYYEMKLTIDSLFESDNMDGESSE